MKLFRNIFCIIIVLTLSNCSEDILDLKPKDKMDAEALFSDPAGVELYMANLYSNLPVEDFNYLPYREINFYEGTNFYEMAGAQTKSFISPMLTDECDHSEYPSVFLTGVGMGYWGYNYLRSINLLVEIIPTLTMRDEEKEILLAECSFLRAYTYFQMVKRYGGVPIITTVQKWTGDVESLKVPRNTEKETWDFVMSECDVAIAGLPEVHPSSSRRANKYVALALKSRAALHAASVAKYWNKTALSGPAVDQGLVGLSASDADGYYNQSIAAAEAIMESGNFSLYMPTPANPEEAAENYRKLFENPNIAPMEAIFIKGFVAPISGQSHSYETNYNPNQCLGAGRVNPTLDLVDAYESYSNPGQSAPIVTTLDGITDDYNGFNKDNSYIRFNTPNEIFNGKDARLFATVIVSGSTWKKQTIIIQGGYIQPDGVAKIEIDDNITVNGVKYYTFGAASVTEYSGFRTYGGAMTMTGFSLKKFLNEPVDVATTSNMSINDWIEMRYAEVLLNYAEAVVESGYTGNNALTKAAVAMNITRRRAGHIVDIPLTLQNVLRERRVEMAFENNRIWDLIRRREYHEVFSGAIRHALVPVLDLRVDPPQYIFVRQNRTNETTMTFLPYQYYRSIPGVATNGLVQNPEY